MTHKTEEVENLDDSIIDGIVDGAVDDDTEATQDQPPASEAVAEAGAEAGALDSDAQAVEDPIAALEAQLAAAQAEAAANQDQLQRLAAEFQNSKRRQEKQLIDAIDRAGSSLIQQLLPVLDDFDLAFQNMPETAAADSEAWVDGFRQIQKKLNAILSDAGLTPVPTEGVFDPNLHEAVTSEPNDDVESGHIIATLRVGYEFKGRVLRPALVRVAM
ncbi:MAG: nucleotide exchange factor GrpE [Caldilineaceae bacterium]|nr:nucleotide exchange factor GrpE [Caldilineaceae bacterium]